MSDGHRGRMNTTHLRAATVISSLVLVRRAALAGLRAAVEGLSGEVSDMEVLRDSQNTVYSGLETSCTYPAPPVEVTDASGEKQTG